MYICVRMLYIYLVGPASHNHTHGATVIILTVLLIALIALPALVVRGASSWLARKDAA